MRLEITVSRYYQKSAQNWPFKPNQKNLTHFGHYFGTQCIFLKTDFVLKSWFRAGWFEYHKPNNLNNFFPLIKGSAPLCRPFLHQKMAQIWLYESRSLYGIIYTIISDYWQYQFNFFVFLPSSVPVGWFSLVQLNWDLP